MTWKPFESILSKTNSMDLFRSEGSWINNISIDIHITEITNGSTLRVEHASSDVIYSDILSKPGNYSYLVNTSFVSLKLESTNYSRVVGFYHIIDYGKLHEFSMDGFSFILTMIPVAFIILISKIKKRL